MVENVPFSSSPSGQFSSPSHCQSEGMHFLLALQRMYPSLQTTLPEINLKLEVKINEVFRG